MLKECGLCGEGKEAVEFHADKYMYSARRYVSPRRGFIWAPEKVVGG